MGLSKCFFFFTWSLLQIRLLQKTDNYHITEVLVNTSVGPCRRYFALNLTQVVHSHLHTWHTLMTHTHVQAGMHERTVKKNTQKKHMLFSDYKLAENTVCPCLHWSVTCDWMKAACSHPVSRLGFISSCSSVWAPHICQKTVREN